MAEHVLGATVRAEAAERGCFSPSIAAPAPGADRGRRPATGTGQSLPRADVKREDITANSWHVSHVQGSFT